MFLPEIQTHGMATVEGNDGGNGNGFRAKKAARPNTRAGVFRRTQKEMMAMVPRAHKTVWSTEKKGPHPPRLPLKKKSPRFWGKASSTRQ